MNFKNELDVAIKQEFKNLQSTQVGSEEYKAVADVLTKLIDRANEIEKCETERVNNERTGKHEVRDRWIQNGIAVAGIVVPCLVTVWGTKTSLQFEETGTVTTMAGRSFVSKTFGKK